MWKNKRMMTLYHKNGCPICSVAIKKLAQKNINYNDVLVDPNNDNDINFQYLLSLGVKGFPVLIIDDQAPIVGNEVSKWINQQEVQNEH